jgi:hypothetical protein
MNFLTLSTTVGLLLAINGNTVAPPLQPWPTQAADTCWSMQPTSMIECRWPGLGR